MKTSALSAVVVGLCCSFCGSAQVSASDETSALALRIEPKPGPSEIFRNFTILIVNNSNHDVRLPMPNPECADVPYGTVKFHVNLKPPLAGIRKLESSCFSDYGYTPILDRIKAWRVLRPGQSLVLKNASVPTQNDGKYEVWASYSPPGVPTQDEVILVKAGVDFPRCSLESSHLSFVR